MKKFLSIVVLGVLLILSFVTTAKAQTDSTDQSCDLSGGGGLGQFNGTNTYTTFTPSLNRLSKVRLFLDGGAGGVPITLKIYRGGSELVNAGTQNSPVGGPTSLTWDFTDTEVTPGDSTYRIWPQTDGGLVDWLITPDTNCNAGGVYYRDGAAQGMDVGFTTYGWNYTAPEEAAPEDDPDPDTPGNNSNTGNTNSQVTTGNTPTSEDSTANTETENQSTTSDTQDNSAESDTIKPPTDLKAADIAKDKGGSIKLSWKASETVDIESYEIFRSKKAKDDFASLGKVDKNTLEFVDKTATKNVTFYYYVRVVKGEKTSKESNTVSAKSLDNTSKSKVANAAAEQKDKSYTWYIVGAVVLLLFGGSLFYYFKIYKLKHPKVHPTNNL